MKQVKETLLPKKLWKEADALIRFVSTYPFEKPKCCKHCGSLHFRLSYSTGKSRNNIDLYYCLMCKRTFSQLTNSYFAYYLHLDTLGDFARLRLAGKSTNHISTELGISLKAAVYRVKLLEKIAQENYPALYQWWKPQQDYLDHTFCSQVEAEKNIFINWLHERIHSQKATCPHCDNEGVSRVKSGAKERTKHRPYFFCGRCKQYFHLLEGTVLKRLYHIEVWIPFVEGLVKGESCAMLSSKLEISNSSALSWKKAFLMQMQTLQLFQLIHWLKWKTSRSYAFKARKYIIRKKRSRTENRL